ncbi:MAG: hypothetical protein R3B82_02160 [Sandaracinaceae bacterium]
MRIDRDEPRDLFVDMQVRGPYRPWRHTHTFEDVEGGRRCVTSSSTRCPSVPGTLARWLFVSRTLERIFDHRAASIAESSRRSARP